MKRKNLENKNNSKIFFLNKNTLEKTMKLQNNLYYLELENFDDHVDNLTTYKKYIPYYTPLTSNDTSTIKEILEELSSTLKREITLQDPEYFNEGTYGEVTFNPEDISLPYMKFLEKYNLVDWHYQIFKDLIVIQQLYLEAMPGLIYKLNEGPVRFKK